jgi:hypothetical protein
MPLQDAAGHRDEENHDNTFLHRTHTNRAQHLTKRKQIQLVTFCQLKFSRFEKRKGEFSSSDPADDCLGTYGQFNVPQWIKSGITIRETSYRMITTPTLFVKHKSLRLSAPGNVEESLERSRV